MLEDGYIKLHRSILKWEWYSDRNVRELFYHLLLIANHEPKKWKGTTILRGQAVTSIDKLSKESGLSVSSVRTALNKLKSTGELTSESTSRFTLITIVNYDKYQSNDKAGDKLNDKPIDNQATNERQAADKQTTTNNESKKENGKTQEIKSVNKISKENNKKDKKINPPIAPLKKQNFAEFVSMTNDEYSSLVAKVGEDGAKRCIEILDNYKGAGNKKYASDYRAILNWVIERYQEELAKIQPKGGLRYDKHHVAESYDIEII